MYSHTSSQIGECAAMGSFLYSLEKNKVMWIHESQDDQFNLKYGILEGTFAV